MGMFMRVHRFSPSDLYVRTSCTLLDFTPPYTIHARLNPESSADTKRVRGSPIMSKLSKPAHRKNRCIGCLPRPDFRSGGEMAERFKAHAWKA